MALNECKGSDYELWGKRPSKVGNPKFKFSVPFGSISVKMCSKQGLSS